MTLTKLIRKLESQLKNSEKLTRQYDAQASALRKKLTGIASIVGKRVASTLLMDGPKSGRRKSRRKRGMSAAGRASIRAAQKARWAAFHAKHGRKGKKSTAGGGRKRRGNLSRAGRANIIAAQKARWAAYKKNKGKQ